MSMNSLRFDFSKAKAQDTWQACVVTLASCVLLASVALKTSSPIEAIAISRSIDIPVTAVALLAQIELFLAVALLSGIYHVAVRLSAAFTFSLFAVAAFIMHANGQASCGCFGAFRIAPLITAVGDTAIAILLMSTLRIASPQKATTRRTIVVSMCIYALLAFSLLVVFRYRMPSPLESLQDGDSAANSIVLAPDTWAGGTFPLVPYLVHDQPLDLNDATFLLFHHDCNRCRTVLPVYEQKALNNPSQNVILIEVPPYGELPLDTHYAKRAKLTNEHVWFVETPVEVEVVSGRVVRAMRQ